jgi:hypothetical protein
MLAVTSAALKEHGPGAQISQHISFGDQRFAQGSSAEDIVSNMYSAVVTLGRLAEESANILSASESNAPRSTETLRKYLRRAFKKNDPNGYQHYWRDSPVIVPDDEGRRAINLQIWNDSNGLFNPQSFASIISVCYNNKHYRSSFLNGAYHDLTIARTYMGNNKSKGAIFILRPTSSEFMTEIENEIDNSTWILGKKFGIYPVVEDSKDSLTQKAISFMI